MADRRTAPVEVPAVLRVVVAGLTSVQDLGRRRAGQVGQAAGGALDRYSAERANALVGSHPDAPLLELLVQPFAAVTDRDVLVAVTGADADVTLDGVRQPQWQPVLWRRGQQLRIAGSRDGLRVYVGLHGALEVPRLLGSCAPDSVLGFGGPLPAGAELVVRGSCPVVRNPFLDLPVFRFPTRPHPGGSSRAIDVTDGPDADQFGGTGQRLLTGGWTVAGNSNHIGLRLTPDGPDGALPRRVRTDEVLSRGVPVGAVEVPAGDELLVLHRGRGVTAGYPVLAVVTSVGLSRLGQARPGDRVRFRRVDVATAVASYRTQQAHLDVLRTRVATAFAEHRIPLHPSSGPVVPTLRESA